MTAKLTVYYDGACPLCAREIAFYKRRRGAGAVDWVDLTQSGAAPGGDLSCAAALARFHVRLENGELRDGAGAFAALLKRLPALRWLGILISLPGIAWLAERGYDAFLTVRPALTRLIPAPRPDLADGPRS
ncbi:MAG: DUF393 domain-containing protein [Pseudomonadota bacterium]